MHVVSVGVGALPWARLPCALAVAVALFRLLGVVFFDLKAFESIRSKITNSAWFVDSQEIELFYLPSSGLMA